MRRLFIAAVVAACAAGRLFASPVEDWEEYEAAVRDGTVAMDEALVKLDPLIEGLSTYITSNYDVSPSSWTFPVTGYDRCSTVKGDYTTEERHRLRRAVGTYDFFDGGRHFAHPGYNIHVRDANFDTKDDLTGAPPEVVAAMDSVVISTYKRWTRGSMFRDGNYVWLYNPAENKLFYYAHLQDIRVDSGQFVRSGEPIASVGPTGFMPRGKREKTHLYLMVLEYDKGRFLPVDYYSLLSESHPPKEKKFGFRRTQKKGDPAR